MPSHRTRRNVWKTSRRARNTATPREWCVTVDSRFSKPRQDFSSEIRKAPRLGGMTQRYCPQCGRTDLPCPYCSQLRPTAEDEFLDAWYEELEGSLPEGETLFIWFAGPADVQRQLLNRLLAEWPHAYEVVEPPEEGCDLGVVLASDERLLGGAATYLEVSETRVRRMEGPWWG